MEINILFRNKSAVFDRHFYLFASVLVTLIISGTMTTHGRTSGWPKGTNPLSYAAKYGITNPSPTLDRPINLYVFI